MDVRGEPKLVLRPEHDEWGLVRRYPALVDAALVPDRYAAPYPPGHSAYGKDHQRLDRAVTESRIELWRDPDTSGLVSKTINRISPEARLRLIPAGRYVRLPIDVRDLRNGFRRNLFTDACLEGQVGSKTLAAPYFDFRAVDDPRLRLNLEMARRVALHADDQVPTVFVQMTRNRMLAGLGAAVAPLYAATGVRRAIVRVRGWFPQQATADELTAFLDMADAFDQRGLEVIADCVGRLGPVLVAECTRGFSTGTRFFRSVPAALLSPGGGGGGIPLGQQIAGTWSERPREPRATPAQVRVENLRTLRELSLLASRDPWALIASLRADPSPYSRTWAHVLDVRRQRSA
jgi:hypothetical protein